jgi:outer membrane protein assembly factor BamB
MDGRLIAVNIVDGSRLWAVQLEMGATSGGGFGCAQGPTSVAIYGSPAVSDNLVYVGGYNGKVYAYPTAGREEPRWVYPRQGNLAGSIVGSLVTAEGRVYFASASGTVYALDAAEGYKVWEFRTKEKIWSTPAIAGDTLFIGSFDKKLYAIDTTTGKEKWEKPFETEGAIVSTPLVYNNTVYVGSFDRCLYALDTDNGSLKWKFKAGNWFWAKPVVYNGVIYAGNLDGKLYVLKADTGEKVTEFDLKSPISSSPVLVGNLVIVATQDGVVSALDTTTNQEKWKNGIVKQEKQKIYAALAVSQGVVYIHTDKDILYALNAQSGAKLWSISLKS